MCADEEQYVPWNEADICLDQCSRNSMSFNGLLTWLPTCSFVGKTEEEIFAVSLSRTDISYQNKDVE